MRKFNITPASILTKWIPVGDTNSELDNMPECYRCTKRMGYRCAVEAYGILDEGDRRVDVFGRCRGVCHQPKQGAREPKSTMSRGDNWFDVVRIQWDKHTDQKAAEMVLGKGTEEGKPTDLHKQISAIVFFQPDAEEFT